MTWQDEALCRNLPLDRIDDVFFPKGETGRGHTTSWAEAREWCRTCPVTARCLMYAIDNNLTFGMYGGLTPDERVSLKRANRRYTPPTKAGHAARMELWMNGASDREIAELTNVSRDTIGTWRRAQGLKANGNNGGRVSGGVA